MTNSVDLLHKIIALKPNGETRTQQEDAVRKIETALEKKEHLLLEAPPGSGKALALDTPILTTKGFKNMGDLTEEDHPYGTNGKPLNILKAHDPFISKKQYAITFSDGTVIYADAEHLWTLAPLVKNPFVEVREQHLEEAEHLSTQQITLQDADGNQISLKEFLNTQSFPEHIAYNALTYVDAIEAFTYSLESFLESLFRELRDRSITWTTEQIAEHHKRTLEGQELHLRIRTPMNTLQYPDEDTKLPVPAALYGAWLNGDEHALSEEHKIALQLIGVTDNSHIHPAFLFGTARERSQLYSGMLSMSQSLDFQTTIPSLADDFQTLTASLGYRTNRISIDNSVEIVLIDTERDIEEIVDIQLVSNSFVRCITVDSEDHLFLAGRTLIPTHNTLSYLIPLRNSRAVVATANKQLSEQAYHEDLIGFLNNALPKVGEKPIKASLLKGRDNYACLAKANEAKKADEAADALFSQNDANTSSLSEDKKNVVEDVQALSKWLDKTSTGDRTEAPAVSEEIWRQFSSTTAECPGKSACPFGGECFAEIAREQALESPLVITNHAIVAMDMLSEGQLLGDRDVFVFDELHELDNYLSSAWGAEVTHKTVTNIAKLMKSIPSVDAELVTKLQNLVDKWDETLKTTPSGRLETSTTSRALETYILDLYAVTTKLASELSKKEKETGTDALKRIYIGAKKRVEELSQSMSVLADKGEHTVRWIVDKDEEDAWKTKYKKKGAAKNLNNTALSARSLHAKPLQIGDKLQAGLEERDAQMIGLSATVTVGGAMDIPIKTLALTDKPHSTLVLDTPFDFYNNAMLHIPHPNDFPAPIGQDRLDHAAAFKEITTPIIDAVEGRALILSTTSRGVADYTEHYRKELPHINFLAQGEGIPNGQLVDQFKREKTTALVGTMGFWHGLDAPGSTLLYVAIDKLPFPVMSDPLLAARKEYADRNGGNGFMEIMLTIADNMARQAFGRGIRTKTDRVIIGFYDTRLLTKGYGKQIINNFYGTRVYHSTDTVVAAAKRLTESEKAKE